MSNLYGIY